jgi:hypothetical protein
MSDDGLLGIVQRLAHRVRRLETSGSIAPRWATVTSDSPLMVRLDGEVDPLAVTPETLVSDLRIGERVRLHLEGRLAIVTGRAGGGATWRADFTQYDDATPPSAWPTGVTIGNTGDDAGWPRTFGTLRVTKAGNNSRVLQEVWGAGSLSHFVRTANSGTDSWGPWRAVWGSPWMNLALASGYGGVSGFPYPAMQIRADGSWAFKGRLARTAGSLAANTAYNVGGLPASVSPPPHQVGITPMTAGGSWVGRIWIEPTGSVNMMASGAATSLDLAGCTAWPDA